MSPVFSMLHTPTCMLSYLDGRLYASWILFRLSYDTSLKHITTLFSLSDHYILSQEWRVIVDQVQFNNYHGRPYSNELPYEYMLALRTTALTQADRKSLQRVRNRPKRQKSDTGSNIFHRIGFI